MKKTFLSATFLIFFASILNSISSYILQILFSRFLSVEDYGVYNAVNSLTFFFVFITTPLQNFTIKSVVQKKTKLSDIANLLSYYKKKFLFSINLLSIPLGIACLITGVVTKLNIFYVLIIILMCFIGNIYSSFSAFLSGLQLFIQLALATLLFTIIRFSILALSLLNGIMLNGIMFITILIAFINCIVFYHAIPKTLRVTINNDFTEYNSFFKSFIPYFLKTGIIYFVFSALMQSDTLLIKYFFSDFETGIYSSASIFGKAVMYLPGAIVSVLFPLVADNTDKGQSSLSVLLKALGINLLLSGGGALCLFLFPNLVTLFFGNSYNQAIPIMKYLGFAFLPLSMINILFTFYLAKDRYDCLFALLLGLITELTLVTFFHQSLQQAVWAIFIAGIVGICGFLMIEIRYRKLNQLKQRSKYE